MSLQFKKILPYIISLLVGILLSWKSMTYHFEHESLLNYLHLGFQLIVAAALPFIIIYFRKDFTYAKMKEFIILSFYLVLAFCIGLNVNHVVRNWDWHYVILTILPLAFFPIGKILGGRINDKILSVCILISLLFLAELSFIHMLFQGFIYGNIKGSVSLYPTVVDVVQFPFFRAFIRPVGVTSSPHSSATLMAAIFCYAVFQIFFYRRKMTSAIRVSLSLLAFFSGATLILSLVGQGMLAAILGMCMILFFLPWQIKTKILITLPAIGLISFIVYFREIGGPWKYFFEIITSLSEKKAQDLILILAIGEGSINARNFLTGEIFLLCMPFTIGLIPFIIISKMIVQCVNENTKNLTEWNFRHYLIIIPVVLVFGSLHYNSIFIYPNNAIFFFILGLLYLPVGHKENKPNC